MRPAKREVFAQLADPPYSTTHLLDRTPLILSCNGPSLLIRASSAYKCINIPSDLARTIGGFLYLNDIPLGGIHDSLTLHPRVYFSHDARTRQTTIVTTDLNEMHLSMIEHLNMLSGTSIQPEETAQLLVKCFDGIQEHFTITAVKWDRRASGPVYYSMHLFTTPFQ